MEQQEKAFQGPGQLVLRDGVVLFGDYYIEVRYLPASHARRASGHFRPAEPLAPGSIVDLRYMGDATVTLVDGREVSVSLGGSNMDGDSISIISTEPSILAGK